MQVTHLPTSNLWMMSRYIQHSLDYQYESENSLSVLQLGNECGDIYCWNHFINCSGYNGNLRNLSKCKIKFRLTSFSIILIFKGKLKRLLEAGRKTLSSLNMNPSSYSLVSGYLECVHRV